MQYIVEFDSTGMVNHSKKGVSLATSGELCHSIATALGISFETAREHLRNIRRAGMISFKGHGRGAAEMTTLDASRLLIATAASPFTKASVATVEAFGSLLPNREGRLKANLETHLANMLQRLIDERANLAPAYRRPSQVPEDLKSRMALTFVSAVNSTPADFPMAAIVRRFRNEVANFDFEAVRFTSEVLLEPVADATSFAVQTRNAGLIQTREVPAWTLAEIAHSL